ncbi:MFS transporter [Actinoallomurus vinaceus]
MTMAIDIEAEERGTVAVWNTFRESQLAVKVLLVGVFLSRLGGFLNIFIVLYLAAKGYSTERSALALSVYGAGGVAGLLLGATLADRLGARNSAVLGMTATAVLTASLLYLPGYPAVLVAVGLASVAAQIYRPSSAALLSELTPEDRQVMIFGMYRFGLNLGATAAPLLGFALFYLGGREYTLLFWGEGLIALAYAVLALVAIPARSRPASGTDASAESGPARYLAMFHDRRYLLFLFATMLNAVVYVQYLSTLPLEVKAAHVWVLWYTVAVSLNGLIVVVFELPLTKISQHWPTRFTVGLTLTLVGLGNACYGFPISPVVIIGATLVWTLGEILGGPSVFAYPAMAAPPPLKSLYIGGFQFMHTLGTAVGPIIGGALFVRLGHGVWPVMALAGLAAAVLGVAAIRPTDSP